MKTAASGRPAAVRREQQRSPWPILLVLLLFVTAAATALYRVYKLTAVPRLQICDAKLGPYVYNALNSTIQDLKLNITLCWK